MGGGMSMFRITKFATPKCILFDAATSISHSRKNPSFPAILLLLLLGADIFYCNGISLNRTAFCVVVHFAFSSTTCWSVGEDLKRDGKRIREEEDGYKCTYRFPFLRVARRRTGTYGSCVSRNYANWSRKGKLGDFRLTTVCPRLS